jgi:hypothetical protein
MNFSVDMGGIAVDSAYISVVVTIVYKYGNSRNRGNPNGVVIIAPKY